ncbi:MAG: hypothetical protein FD187_1834 [bacterium]|nr:MAG: hypothetical protein FD142_1159 [bacterium]KAF0148645.1 MAG: hypothetical protein FD187_1834 [bacterium]KAF0167949.1 MAG: hypothetical protein FD158_1844 [bacterium]TXT18161.1 MAG: hypothetical protein FD132_2159 [bacterium]
MRQTKAPQSFLSLCLLAGITAISLPAWSQSSASVFISNMPALQSDAAGPGSQRWMAPTANLANYDKVLLEPLTLYIAPDSEEKGLNPDALKSLADEFHKLVSNQLEPSYPVVNKPGKGVLVLRPALTNVQIKKKSRGLLSFTPIGLVAYAAREAYAKEYSLEKAALEVEVLDGVSGERIGVLIDRSPEKTNVSEDKSLDWTRIEDTYTFYAKRLQQRLDAARGGAK